MTSKINIIDLGMGNTASLEHWIRSCNFQPLTVTSPESINSNILILPGAGSAGTFMEKLKSSGFVSKLHQLAEQKCKIIGICLGFQILFDHSEEEGGTECLKLLRGRVSRLNDNLIHNGWEHFELDKRQIYFPEEFWKVNKLRTQKISGRVYFNHEFGVIVGDSKYQTLPINTTLSHYAGFIIHKNILGMQFHPEKSQDTGKKLLQFLVG